MTEKLNRKQEQIFNQLKAFIKDKTIDTFILNGYAGTGKTFLIQQFAHYLQKEKKKFALLATTGRAASILKGKTGLLTSTVHGALYIFSKIDGDHEDLPDDAPADHFGAMKLIFEPVSRISENCIYIVDEASMIASDAVNNNSYAQFGTGAVLPELLNAIGKNKIIFVGDPCQLPPIRQEVSPALDDIWLNNNGRVTAVGTLDEIMRTDPSNDILQIASEVRENIGIPPKTKWIKLQARNKNKCTIHPDANTIFLEYYTRFLQYGPKDCIAIAHSNKACGHLNEYFRKRLFPHDRKLVEHQEVIMVTQNNNIYPISNGDFAKVIETGEISSRANLNFQDVRIELLATGKDYQLKLALDSFNSFTPNLSTDQQRNLMIDFSRRMRKKGIKPNSKIYEDAMRLDPYLNSLRATYGYAVTCHKAQGGEWEEVFLFLDKSMYGYMSADSMRRWWYTAITRAKERLHIHDEWWLV